MFLHVGREEGTRGEGYCSMMLAAGLDRLGEPTHTGSYMGETAPKKGVPRRDNKLETCLVSKDSEGSHQPTN